MRQVLFAAVVAAAVAAAPAAAQTSYHSKGTKGAKGTKPVSDQTFVAKAAEGGLAEVELGKLATEKAASDQVKKFGQRMVDDHGKANDELKGLAQTKSITIPSDLNTKDKALRDRLSKLSGEAFDRAYMQAMVRDHRKDVNEFRTESQSGKDAEVKSWAGKTLPTLEEHLKLAEDANRAVGTSGVKK